MNGKVRNLFPGGNTSLGFFSYYDNIIAPDATRIFIIKGGPGVGKSFFMKEIAKDLNEQGFDVELHHCSSDPDSLDGVVFPQISVAIMDGTSPHVVDPRNPGAVDEILHLGDYWDEQGIRRGKEEILTLNREVGRLFRRAYQYLKAAKIIHDDQEEIYTESVDFGLVNEIAADLSAAVFEGRPAGRSLGKIRRLFISAITPKGLLNYLPDLTDKVTTVYAIQGPPGTGKATILNKLAVAAQERGIHCEAFYCAFDPHKIEHLLIPDLDTVITTAVKPHRIDITKATSVINTGKCVDLVKTSSRSAVIEADQRLMETLLEQAIKTIAQAKSVHDEIETYYIPNMDFTAIDKLRNRTMERILKYSGETTIRAK